jgi:hypothetical protein
LFSAILGEGTSHGLGEMPDIQIGLQYLEEFPDGPFADEASLIIGNFYNDLFKVLKSLEDDESHGYKYGCYSEYVEERDFREQANRAQRLSIDYYSKVLALLADSAATWAETKDVARWKLEMQEGRPDGWHFCAD